MRRRRKRRWASRRFRETIRERKSIEQYSPLSILLPAPLDTSWIVELFNVSLAMTTWSWDLIFWNSTPANKLLPMMGRLFNMALTVSPENEAWNIRVATFARYSTVPRLVVLIRRHWDTKSQSTAILSCSTDALHSVWITVSYAPH